VSCTPAGLINACVDHYSLMFYVQQKSEITL